MSKKQIFLFIVLSSSLLALVGLVSFRSYSPAEIQVGAPEKTLTSETRYENDDSDRLGSSVEDRTADAVPSSPGEAHDERSCGNRTHREWAEAERERLDDFTVEPWQFTQYAGLNEAQIQDLVDQGDTKAMVIMGMRSRLLSLGRDPHAAVPYLIAPYKLPSKIRSNEISADEKRDHSSKAAEYFYQAAIHGRLLALRTYGEQLELAGFDAESLGWVSADRYAELSDVEKAKLRPSEVFESLAYDLVPNLVNEWTESVRFVYSFDEDYTELRNRILTTMEARFREELNQDGNVLPVVRQSEISRDMVQACRD